MSNTHPHGRRCFSVWLPGPANLMHTLSFCCCRRNGIFAAGALLFRIPDTAWPHAFLILSPKPVHMTACVRVFECMVVTAGAFLVWLTSTPPLHPVRTIFSFWLFEIIILYLSHVISDSMLKLSSFAHVGRRLWGYISPWILVAELLPASTLTFRPTQEPMSICHR